MLLNKEKYDDLRRKIDGGILREKDIENLNADLMDFLVESYLNRDYPVIIGEIKTGQRFKNLFLKITKDSLSFYIGFFNGILRIFEMLLYTSKKQSDFHATMLSLCGKANINNILNYLYENPDSQHKTISTDLQINKGYLTQLLKELEIAGCVERYASGKRSFFSLSLSGQALVKKERIKSKVVTNENNEWAILEDKYKMNTSYIVHTDTGILHQKYKYAPNASGNLKAIYGKMGEERDCYAEY